MEKELNKCDHNQTERVRKKRWHFPAQFGTSLLCYIYLLTKHVKGYLSGLPSSPFNFLFRSKDIITSARGLYGRGSVWNREGNVFCPGWFHENRSV